MAFIPGEVCIKCGQEIRPGESVYQDAKPGGPYPLGQGYVVAHMGRCPQSQQPYYVQNVGIFYR